MDVQPETTMDDVRPLEVGDPRAVGGYVLLGRIGSGGMATVYLGCAPGDPGTRVAVKTIHPHLALDAALRERFQAEAVLAGRVASFCTARVLAHGEEEGRPYIVSEYVGGVSLRHRIATGGPLRDAEAHGVAVSVASALAAIHTAGLVHRDLKPANVMLTLSGCRVIDFGIARFADEGAGHAADGATSGTVLGTPGWIAPELISGGQVTPASDIFSWGCLVAYACTGRMPFGQGEPVTVVRRALRNGPDLDGVPAPLLPAVRAALAPRPEDRPAASDLLLSLVEQVEPAAVTPPDLVASAAGQRAGDHSGTGAGEIHDRDGGPDTAEFSVLGHMGARTSPRVRLLAGAAAAAAALMAGGLVTGMARAGGDGTPASRISVPPPSAPATATAPARPDPDRRAARAQDRPGHGPEHAQGPPGKQKGKGKHGRDG